MAIIDDPDGSIVSLNHRLLKALILAAGLGTRLRPLTDQMPKALVPVNGVSLLERAIMHMHESGVKEILINVHHFADQVETFIDRLGLPDVQFFIQDERIELLDTGGSIKQAAGFFKDSEIALVINADVISNLDLLKMKDFHIQNKAAVTLDVRDRKSGRMLLFGPDRKLVGWENVGTASYKWVAAPVIPHERLAFSGIQMIDPKVFNKFPERNVFSSIDWYLQLAATHRILAYEQIDSIWLDVGTPEKLKAAEQFLSPQ